MPTALALTVTLFLLAGGVVYLIFVLRRRAEGIQDSLVDWSAAGRRRANDEDATDDD